MNFLIIYFILYPSSYSGFEKERMDIKVFNQLSLSGLILTYISEPVFSDHYSEKYCYSSKSIFSDNVTSESSLESKEGFHLKKGPGLMGDPQLLSFLFAYF